MQTPLPKMNIISRIEECFANPDNGAFALNRRDAEAIIKMLRAGEKNEELLRLVNHQFDSGTLNGMCRGEIGRKTSDAVQEYQNSKES